MKRRIYVSFFVLVLICVTLVTASVSIITYNATRSREIFSIKDRANLVAEILNNAVEQNLEFYFTYFDEDAARITVISYDGTVLLDNKVSPVLMENHSDREEFKAAIANGYGEIMRYSETFGSDTYYYALRLNSGNVLRISKTMDRISGVYWDVFLSITGITIVILILAGILAGRLARRIVNPINKIDLDSGNPVVYDELSPFVRKIDKQKNELAEQLRQIKDSAGTIDTITTSMKEGLILIDKTGMILASNKAAAEILGGNNLFGMNILHVKRDLDFCSGVNKCLEGEKSEITLWQESKKFTVYFNPVHDCMITGGVILFTEVV